MIEQHALPVRIVDPIARAFKMHGVQFETDEAPALLYRSR
jgi:hypothetical protein